MTGSAVQNGDIYPTYGSVMTDPANEWIGPARGVCRRERLDPKTRKAMAMSSTDGRPAKVTFAAGRNREIGLKKEWHWSLRCVAGQLTCLTSAPIDTQRAAIRWLQGDEREPADGRRAN